jgi:cytoskeletal protein CcmA (bactofilin family)
VAGSAIGTSVLVAMLMLTICYFAMMKSSLFAISEQEFEEEQKNRENIYSGLEILKSSQVELEKQLVISIYESGDTLKLSKKKWGVYEIGEIIGSLKNHRDTLYCLMGCQPDSKANRVGLYYPDRNSSVRISGSTRIYGNAYIPEAGIESAIVGGMFYTGEEKVYGQQFISQSTLPVLYEKTVEGYLALMDTLKKNSVEQIASSTYKNSFANPTIVMGGSNEVELYDLLIEGNVIVYSKEKVIITAKASLNDVMVIAPNIEIEDGFAGSLQLCATQNIEIGENVKLNYPSSICLLSKEKGSSISIGKDFYGSGTIYCANFLPENTGNTYLVSKESFMFEGEIYCMGMTMLNGEIKGTIYTSLFGYKTEEVFVQNVICNLKVLPDDLPDFLVVGNSSNKNRNVVKWLN